MILEVALKLCIMFNEITGAPVCYTETQAWLPKSEDVRPACAMAVQSAIYMFSLTDRVKNGWMVDGFHCKSITEDDDEQVS